MTSVVFDGAKFFWRTRNTVDILIIEHKALEIFELIVYDPSFDVEAPRIYIDSKTLMSRVDNEEIESKLSFAKRNGVPLTENFVAGVVNKVVSDYLLSRIIMKEYLTEEKKILVDLTNGDMCGVLNEKPELVEEYKTKHYQRLMEGVVEQVLTALKEEKKELHESTTNAAELAGLNNRQRWRMPLVINKVDRGERLNANDRKIFSRVQANMKTEEDIVRMKSCMGNSSPISAAVAHSTVATGTGATTTTTLTSPKLAHNLSPTGKSTTPTSHSPKQTPAHSPRRSLDRQPSLRRAPSSTLHMNTESSMRRAQENNGANSPAHSTKPKKHGKKGRKGAKRKNSTQNSVSAEDGTTTADGEWEDEEDQENGGEQASSFGLIGSFKSMVGSVKSALFGARGSGSGSITTGSKEYSQNIQEEQGGKERQTAGDKPLETGALRGQLGERTPPPTSPSATHATTTAAVITTTTTTFTTPAGQHCTVNDGKEEESATVRDQVKPTRRTSQLGPFLSTLTSFVKGWGTGSSTATASSNNKIVPTD